jgi:hypothetical protein
MTQRDHRTHGYEPRLARCQVCGASTPPAELRTVECGHCGDEAIVCPVCFRKGLFV